MPTLPLIIIFSIVFLFHWILYKFFVESFSIRRKKVKFLLALITIFLSFSFVICSIIRRIDENIFTNSLYFLSSLWIGVLINLVLTIIVFYIVLLIFKLFKKKLNKKIFAYTIIIFVSILSIYGVWNAYHPTIVNVTVDIKNLSEEWEGKKIVQISDVHLDGNLGENFLELVVNKINNENAEIVVITGDLFDGSVGNLEKYTEMLDKIESKSGVYFITGNHEGYAGTEKILSALRKTNINILDDEIVEIDGLQLIGVSYPAFGHKKDLNEIIRENGNFDPDKTNILLYHTPTSISNGGEGSNHNNMYWVPNIDFTETQNLGIDLQLSGHTHNGQIFPFNYIAAFIYDGYQNGLKKINGFSIYTSSGTGVWGPPMRTSNRSEIVVITLKKTN